MPELPEVETVRRGLELKVRGKVIEECVIHYPPIAHGMTSEQWTHLLKGHAIDRIDRRGKFLIITIGPHRIISHLRMEGKYFVGPLNTKHLSVVFSWPDFHSHHAHLGIRFTDGTVLVYHDTRKFGRLHLYPHYQGEAMKELAALGIEPIDDLPKDYFYEHVHHSQRTLKQLLLDQSILLGLGNIYADETCHVARVYPFMRGSQLSRPMCQRIESAARQVLQEAIVAGGTTIRSYEPSHYINAQFERPTLVYGNEHLPCSSCGSLIRRNMRIGRSTYWCPMCQKR